MLNRTLNHYNGDVHEGVRRNLAVEHIPKVADGAHRSASRGLPAWPFVG